MQTYNELYNCSESLDKFPGELASSASCTKGRRQHCNIAPYNNIRVFRLPPPHRLVTWGDSPIFGLYAV